MINRELDLRMIAKRHEDKLKKIKLCLFDCDGILTDGKVYWGGSEVGFNRQFHVSDGYGLRLMMRAGIKVGIITGGDSQGVKTRFEALGVDYLYMGNEDKLEAYESILSDAKVSDEETLYMGDEFFDLPLLKRVGFAATVPHASIEIREQVDYVTFRECGEGCAREVIDMVRHAQNLDLEKLV